MLRAALWVFGGALTASGVAGVFRLLGVWAPGLGFLAYPALALWGAGFLLGVAVHAHSLGRRRACLILFLANPFAWITLLGFLLGVLGLVAGGADPMGLGLAIAGLGALFFGLFLLWLLGACLTLVHSRLAALYGGLSGLVLVPLGDLLPETGGTAAVLGAILCYLGRPIPPVSAGQTRKPPSRSRLP